MFPTIWGPYNKGYSVRGSILGSLLMETTVTSVPSTGTVLVELALPAAPRVVAAANLYSSSSNLPEVAGLKKSAASKSQRRMKESC